MTRIIINFCFNVDERDNDDCFLFVFYTSINDKFKFIVFDKIDVEINKN